MGRLGTPETVEERRLAARVAGVLWLTAGVAFPFAVLLPGVPHEPDWAVGALIGACVGWGVLCWRIDAERAPALVFHLPAAAALPLNALAVLVTGQADSPARLYMFFLVAFVGYFYAPRAAIPYFVGAVGVHATPLLYDTAARSPEFVGELVVAGFSYAVLGAVLLTCKHQLTEARKRADMLSLTDPLTGLPNRRALTRALERHAAEAPGAPLGLLLVDLDDFKEANTRFGLPGGDLVLMATGRAIRSAARGEDLVTRLGGDEFAVVASGATPAAMDGLADRVLDAVRASGGELDLAGYRPSASAGWALYPADGATIDDLTSAADLALRASKVGGKDRSSAAGVLLPQPAPAA